MRNFSEKERGCEAAFFSAGPYWHLCTPGKEMSIIFRDESDYRYGMTLMARCSLEVPAIRILAFTLMSNHLHIVCSGKESDVRQFFEVLRHKLYRYCSLTHKDVGFSGFRPNIIPICDLRAIRNTIAYVHRNGYVVNPDYTPFSYPWGTGGYYFNIENFSVNKIKNLSTREQKSLTKSRIIPFPDEYEIRDGYISPKSFCDIKLGMMIFRDGQNYFSSLAKNLEAYTEIAKTLQDSTYLSDDEIFAIIFRIVRDEYKLKRISELNFEGKVTIARKMHYEFGASNQQIRRILGLEQNQVDSLFPLSIR